MIKKEISKFIKAYFRVFRVPLHYLIEGVKLSSFTLINYVVGFSMIILLPVGLLTYYFLYVPFDSLFGNLYSLEKYEFTAHFFLLIVFGVNLWILFDYLAFAFLILSPIIISVWKIIMTSDSSYTWADGTTTDGDDSTFSQRIVKQILFLSGLTIFMYLLIFVVG